MLTTCPCFDNLEHRCSSKHIFGGAKYFFPNFPKLAWKAVLQSFPANFLPQRSWKHFLVWHPKKVFLCFSANVGRHFYEIKRWAPFLPEFCVDIQGFCPDFREVCPDFQGISPNFQFFSRIFDKSQLLGVLLHPASYTTDLELDVFHAGGPQCYFMASVTIAVKIRNFQDIGLSYV